MGHEEIRVPPQSQAAERAVLGAMLLDEDAIGAVIESLDSSFFYDASHQKIYDGMVRLYADRKNVDIITLGDRLKSDGVLESVGGSAYLAELADSIPTAANVLYHVEIVKEKGLKRKLIKSRPRSSRAVTRTGQRPVSWWMMRSA